MVNREKQEKNECQQLIPSKWILENGQYPEELAIGA